VQDEISTGIAQALRISQLETAVAGASSEENDPESSDNENGDQNNESGDSQTPGNDDASSEGPATVRVSQATNCRSGPSRHYRYISTANPGNEFQVIGLPADPGISEYVIIRNPSGSGNCWLWLRFADRSDFSSYDLEKYQTPATPTPSSTPTPTYTPSPSSTYTASPTIDLTPSRTPTSTTTPTP